MTEEIKRPELLAPAGDLEKLQTAVRFGADAVYAGAGSYSLRAESTSFSLADVAEGVRFAHEHGCKFYLAMNIYAFDNDLELLKEYFLAAVDFGIDAVIVSDAGVLNMLRALSTGVKFHISTQANTTNSEAVKFWLNNGASRIVAARELTLEQLRQIKENVPETELEVFVHGAMCIAYSGRCVLSRHLTGRSANRGECAHPCRWEYDLNSNGEIFGAEEDQHGTYILNSRDLCLIQHIPELLKAGVDSFKIEGRMKTAYYTAMTTKIYRQAIDTYLADPEKYTVQEEWLANLEKISHRPYTDGLLFPGLDKDTEYTADSAYIKGYDFVGIVADYDPQTKQLTISGRNQFSTGDELEILDHKLNQIQKITLGPLRKNNGEIIAKAHNSYLVAVDLNGQQLEDVSKHSILCRKK